ncbi:unnamed protein product [Orchesella dallaii]|uniref:Uncharacterized protein n=1 Tax=Orchesella dallaii TaxID=48710 RepID=A0ABP1QA20_9HEXA
MAMIDNLTSRTLLLMQAGYKLQVGDAGIIVETAKFFGAQFYARSSGSVYHLKPYSTAFITVDETNFSVTIPTEALQISMNEMLDQPPRLKITSFSEDVFKRMNEKYTTTAASPTGLCASTPNSNDDGSSCHSTTNTTTTSVDTADPYQSWGLLTIELDGIIENLTEPVEFVIANTKVLEGYKLKCVYWDEDENLWSTAGVTTIYMGDEVKCSSTHLTAFSALIEPLPLPFPGAEYAPVNNSVHSFILSVLSTIGSVCSIIGLSFTVLTYALFRSLRRERSNRILLNLSSSLLLMHVMSISGSKSLWDGHCFVPAASLHYLVLTSFAWMMVEALHMFELLISVFVRPENYFLIKRFVLAWGIPLLVVITCTVIEPQMYKAGRADLCLMNAHKNIVIYYVAYIAPICIMLLVNVAIFCRVFRVLYQQTRRTKAMTTAKGSSTKIHLVKISRSQIKGSVTVLVLLGIGWILGLLAMGPFEIFFRYVFCICNAGQGALIFVFRVALNPHACKQWRKVLLGLSLDSSLDVSFTTSSSLGGRGNKRKSTIVSPTFISASSSVENSLTPSNPLSATLATTLASILRSEDERAANCKT